MRLTGLWWWIDRWRKSTAYADMTLDEQGAYRNLIDEAHLRGGAIPNDERILAKACGDALAWKKVRVAVLARFYTAEDGLHNETLDEVMAESAKRARKQADYRNRRNGGGNETRLQSDNPPGNGADNKALPPVPVPVNKIKSSGAARRPVENPRDPDPGTWALYLKIAHESRKKSNTDDQSDDIGNIAAIFKTLCARRNLTCDGDLAARAIASVLQAYSRRRA